MASKEQKEKIKQKYMQFQVLNERLQSLQEQHNALESYLAEMNSLVSNIDEINKSKKPAKILIPVGSNIFAPAKIEDQDKFLVGIGAGVLIKKSHEQTSQDIKHQAVEFVEIINKVEEEIKNTSTIIQKLQTEILAEQ